jgi:hypothetical protein
VGSKDFKHAGGADTFPRRGQSSREIAESDLAAVRAAFEKRERRPSTPGRLYELTHTALRHPDGTRTTKLDLRVSEDEKRRWYAQEHHLSVSELVRETVNERAG